MHAEALSLSQQQDTGRHATGHPLITASVTLIAYLVHTESAVTPRAFYVPLHCSLGARHHSNSILLRNRTRELNTHVAGFVQLFRWSQWLCVVRI